MNEETQVLTATLCPVLDEGLDYIALIELCVVKRVLLLGVPK